MAFTNHGFASVDIHDSGPLTVAIAGAPANSISVSNVGGANAAEITLALNPDRDDDGVPMIIRDGVILTIAPGSIYGFTITKVSSTGAHVVDVYWW